MKRSSCVIFSFAAVLLLGCSLPASAAAPETSAKAFVLIEEKTGAVIAEKNSGKKLPMASTTKIMTALMTLESGGLDDEFVVDPDAIRVEGSSMGLKEGDIVTKRALCAGMLLPSGNDSANAAAVKIAGSIPGFVRLMNERAEKIGMTRTCFATPSGLEGEGHGASAYDMSLLAREALKNPDFCAICSQPSMKVRFGCPPFDRWLKNSNKLLTMYKGVHGVKTGFTDEAGRCLVSACERDGTELICVTLNDRNDWDDHMKLYDYGFSELKAQTVYSSESFDIPVAGGVDDSVKASAKSGLTFGSNEEISKKVTSRVISEPFVYAPVKKGDKVGEIRYCFGERLMGTVDITADDEVQYREAEEKGILDKIKDLLFGNSRTK